MFAIEDRKIGNGLRVGFLVDPNSIKDFNRRMLISVTLEITLLVHPTLL